MVQVRVIVFAGLGPRLGVTNRCRIKGQDQQNYTLKTVDIFLLIRFNIWLVCSKEPSHQDGSSEYSQHMFSLRNKNIINFLLRTFNYVNDFIRQTVFIQPVVQNTRQDSCHGEESKAH